MDEQYLIFTLDGRRCALPVRQVVRVEQSVEIMPLALANLPALVRGVVNVHGALVPVFDLRPSPAQRAVRADEQMILLAVNASRRVIILAESIEGVRAVPRADSAALQALLPPGMAARGGVLNVEGDLVLLHDVEALLGNTPHLETLWQALTEKPT